MSQTGHPKHHGYTKCSRCGTWLRPESFEWTPDAAMTEAVGVPTSKPTCRDVAWCSKQAGAGLGRLDADTGNGPGRPLAAPDSSERGGGVDSGHG